MKKLIAYTLAVIAFWHAANAQNLVTNGGFNTSASGWTTTATSGYFDLFKGNPGGCFVLASPSTPTISQTINGLIPGRSYAILGSYSIEGGVRTNTPSLGIGIDGVFVFQIAQTNFGWFSYGFPYSATSPSITLSIAARINGTSTVYVVDNIVMQPIPSLALQTGESSIVLVWPTNTLGFTLQSATNFDGLNWASVTNTPVIVGTNYTVTLGVSNQVQFFTLKK
ncbi:MAG: hypothetical protein PHY43_08535 [Verrucomicrobiales bacterium]|nr:hypothetical protein [Verrucomicrobiales bacterium]